MTTYTVEITPAAWRDLGKLRKKAPKKALAAIQSATQALGDDPRPQGAKALAGSSGLHRIRVGEFRVVYSVEDAKVFVLVVLIGHRRDVYEKLARRI